jgi:hypothetical protein
MFEHKTVGATRARRSLDPHATLRLKRREPQARARGFFSSMTCGVREFAYLFIDVINGRYDR